MNRRSILTLLVGVMVIPCELASAVMAKESPKSSCEDCKKCDPTCNCNCKKKCKCKPGCCKAERPSPPHRPSSDRHSRYKEMMNKFDKNKDGRLDEKERDTARKFMQERFKSER